MKIFKVNFYLLLDPHPGSEPQQNKGYIKGEIVTYVTTENIKTITGIIFYCFIQKGEGKFQVASENLKILCYFWHGLETG
jgi:hypothetical protein